MSTLSRRDVRAILIGTLAIGTLALTAACENPPIYNVDKAPIVTPDTVTLADVQRAIVIAGSERGWKMIPVAPGRVMAVHSRSGHTATVDIVFDTKEYSIQYVTSALLQERGAGTIHPTYNRWIQFLEADINKHLATLGVVPVPPPAETPPADVPPGDVPPADVPPGVLSPDAGAPETETPPPSAPVPLDAPPTGGTAI